MNRRLKILFCLFITSILCANQVTADIINYDLVYEGPEEIKYLAAFSFVVVIIGALSLITLLVVKKFIKDKDKKIN